MSDPQAPGGPVDPASTATPPTPTRPRRRRDVPLLVFVGVVVLAVVGSLVGLSVATTGSRSPANRSAAAVQGFVEALAAADATKALSYAATPPADPALLTDEVLAANQKAAPIADIVTTPSGTDDSPVDVSYTLGGEPFTDRYRTTTVDGAYKLTQVTNRLSFVMAGVHKLPLLANGVAVESSTAELFPGRYTFSTGLANVSWGSEDEATIGIRETASAPQVKPTVTAAGKKAFVAEAKKTIRTCTARHELQPDGCPFGFRQPTSGPRIPDSSVRWQVKGDPWKTLGEPEIESFTGAGVAKARTSMTFVCTCRFSNGTACKPQDVTNPVTFAADVSQEPLKVVLAAY